MSEQLNSSLVDVLSITLRVPVDRISDDFSPADCQSWDSVRHLMLMLAIEDKFEISFSEKEIAETLEVTERTVQRDWEKARLILAAALR